MTSKTPSNVARLLIRLNNDPAMPIEWAFFDDGVCMDIQPLSREMLPKLAAFPAAKHTHLLIPVEKATCRTVVIPDEKQELSDLQLQWLADETLDEDVPTMHWTLLSRIGTILTVVGVDKSWLERELSALSACGLTVTHATLDAFCLPKVESGWAVLKEGNSWLVRTQEGYISRLTKAWLIHLLEYFPPRQLLAYGTLPQPQTGSSGKAECHIMSLYPDAENSNILHDSVRPLAALSPWTIRLKYTAIFCVVLLAVVASLFDLSYWLQLHQLETQMKGNLVQQWQLYIPENRHNSNLRAYLPAQLQKRSPAPLVLLLRLQSSLAGFPDLALEGVNYNSQKKSFQLFLYATDESYIQSFIKDNTLGFSLKIDKHEQGMWTLSND